jgi:required for meiotic nuclear division protein 1
MSEHLTRPEPKRAAAPSYAESAQHHAEPVAVRALLLGERLDIRSLEGSNALATAPVALSIPGGAVAVLFRYGVVVLFGAGRDIAERFLASIDPFVSEPLPIPEQDEAQLVIRTGKDQHLDSSGNIVLRERTIERLQLVADVLAKNLVLAHYETRIAAIFDRIGAARCDAAQKGPCRRARQGVAAARR